MTKDQIYAFVTSLLDGYEIDSDVFDAFLDVAQAVREGQRPWVALRAEDTSGSVGPSNTFETQNSLPTAFKSWYTRYPIVLTDSSGNPQQYLLEVPINMKSAYKDDPTRFYANYGTSKYYICGTFSQSYTVRLYYIKRATKVSTSGSTTWELDPNNEYSKILGFDVAVLWKLGIDYDILSNPKGDSWAAAANALFKVMENWDGELAESALQGQTYGGRNGYMGEMSGSLGMLS